MLKIKNKTENIKEVTDFVKEPLSLEAKALVEEIRIIQKDVDHRKLIIRGGNNFTYNFSYYKAFKELFRDLYYKKMTINDAEMKQNEFNSILDALNNYSPKAQKYIEAKNSLLNNAKSFYKRREKTIEGLKERIFPLKSDDEFEQWQTSKKPNKYKTSITGNTYNADDDDDNYDANKVGKKETEIVIPLKYLSNFWRSLDIPLINCEVEIILTWSKNCVLADMTVANNPPTGLEFQIKDTKLYVPVVTLSKENDIKLLEQLKSGFKRTIKWNKYRSQMTIQNNNNNLNYLIDRLFVLSFERIEENNVKKDYRDSFSHYYVPKV